MGGDHFTLGHLSGRAQPVAFVACQNVEMKMEDLLPARRFVELLQRHPVG